MRRFVIALLFVLCVASRAGADRAPGVSDEMRSVAWALESYRIDHGAFPPASTLDGQPLPHWLTTPVAYLHPGSHIDFYKQSRVDWYPSRWEAFFVSEAHQIDRVLFLVIGLATFALVALLFFRRDGRKPGLRDSLLGLSEALAAACLLGGGAAFAFVTTVHPRPDRGVRFVLPNPHWTEDWIALSYHMEGGFWVLQSVGPDGVLDLEDLRAVPLADLQATERFLLPFTYDPTNGWESSGDIFRWQER